MFAYSYMTGLGIGISKVVASMFDVYLSLYLKAFLKQKQKTASEIRHFTWAGDESKGILKSVQKSNYLYEYVSKIYFFLNYKFYIDIIRMFKQSNV